MRDHRVVGATKAIVPPLLPCVTVVLLVRAVARQAGVDTSTTDVRHAAILAAFDARLLAEWICPYFGAAPPRSPLPTGWDDQVAGALEEAFT